jgi:hypothetical protein
VSTDESERRLAEALRAQARGGGRPVLPPRARPRPPAPSVPALLALWLLVGTVLGCALAVLSLLVPGALPAFG